MNAPSLHTEADVLISPDVFGVRPSKSAHKIVNQLLNGSYFVQTVGTAADSVDFRVMTSWAGMNRINLAEGAGELLLLKAFGFNWIGCIKQGPIAWTLVSGFYYEADLTLLVMG